MNIVGTVIIVGLLTVLVAACGGNGGNGSAAVDTDTPGPDTVESPGATQDVDCAEQAQVEEIDDAKLLIEYNSTDDDTGVHGIFDSGGFTELCVYAPDGSQILLVKPQGQLRELGMGGIFFESREPVEAEVPQATTLAAFPEGAYEVRATSVDGETLEGTATFTHDIPVPPVIKFPQEDDIVPTQGLVITWELVTETLAGGPAEITAYEVILTDDSDESADPNGFARPILSVHVRPSVSSLSIPSEFLQSGVEYELEVTAQEKSGNQTIAIMFFETE